MDINGGDKNRVFLHDLIKITEGTVSEGTIFMHIKKTALLSIWPKIETPYNWALYYIYSVVTIVRESRAL